MFSVSNLNEKYQYNYSLRRPLNKIFLNSSFDRKDPFEIVSFIYDFVIANKWQWDKITYYNCKRIEFLIQEKVPANIANRREIYLWIVNNWNKYVFPALDDISLN